MSGVKLDLSVERMPIGELRSLQEERLRATVSRAYERSIYYRQKFDAAGVKPSDIKTLDDIGKLPLLDDSEFRSHPIEERMTIPSSEVKVVCSSGGTTGVPSPLPRSESDWRGCIERQARGRWSAGLRPGDLVQELTNYECTGIANELIGVRRMSLCAGRSNLDNQIWLAKMMGVTVIVHISTLAIRYLERAEELGINVKEETKLRAVWGMSEPLAQAYQKRVESKYGIIFLPNAYGTSDVGGAVAVECEERTGLHMFADYCLFEIIDPETTEVLQPGEEGELVITTLTLEALPFIRWRTGDITSILSYEPCPCGRSHPKISVVKGRFPHSVKVNGRRVFGIDIEEVIAGIPGLGDEYNVIVDKPGELRKLKLKVEVKPEVKDMVALRDQVEAALNTGLGVDSEVELVPLGSLGRSLFKAMRFMHTYQGS